VIDPAVWNAAGSSTLVVRRVWAEIERWDILSAADKENGRAATTRRQASSSAPARPSACRMQRHRAEKVTKATNYRWLRISAWGAAAFMRVLSQESWREVSRLACCAMAMRSRSRRP
jgi:hypothetical protein